MANDPSFGRLSPAPAAVSRAAPTIAGKVVVQPGEFVSLIAKRHNISTQAIIDTNGLRAPYTVYPGQVLVLPATDRRYAQLPSSVTVPRNPEPVSYPQSSVEAGPLPTLEPPVASPGSSTSRRDIEVAPLPPPVIVTTAIDDVVHLPAPPPPPPPSAQARAAPNDTPPAPGRGFAWPVEGPVLSDFGPKGGGMHNDGINIGAARGASVRAAESGTVVYAGNEMRGFGNLLLIQHEDGWVTAYAHNETLLVKRGDRVKKAQTIARVGATGGAAAPQLHFEIRRGNRAVNPMDYLVSSNRARAQILKDAAPADRPNPG